MSSARSGARAMLFGERGQFRVGLHHVPAGDLGLRSRLGEHAHLHRGGAGGGEPRKQGAEFQRLEQRGHFLARILAHPALGEIRAQRDVGADGGEGPREHRAVAPGFQFGPVAGRDLLQPAVNFVQRAVGPQEFGGGLLADAFYAGDVIGRVAHQRFVIDQFPGGKTPLQLERRRIVIGGFGERAARQADGDFLAHQLQQIAIAAEDERVGSGFRHLAGERAEHVVGLESLGFENGDAERAHHVPDPVDLRPQVVGHLGARGFIRGEEIVAEGFAGVEGDRQVFRFFFFQQRNQDGGETERAGGRLAARGDPAVGCGARGRQREIRAVRQRVPVQQRDPRCHDCPSAWWEEVRPSGVSRREARWFSAEVKIIRPSCGGWPRGRR